jgi:toxin ParE1/3/4
MTPAEAEVGFHRLAAKEFRAARDWYAKRSVEAAQRFVAATEIAADRIARDFDGLPVVAAGYRQIRVSRFPYTLISRRRNDRLIVIVAVAHTSRRPGYWRRRK